jgi:hypothetical protein
MKTHQEIHEAIQAAPFEGESAFALFNILHALNDRIEAMNALNEVKEFRNDLSIFKAQLLDAVLRMEQELAKLKQRKP